MATAVVVLMVSASMADIGFYVSFSPAAFLEHPKPLATQSW